MAAASAASAPAAARPQPDVEVKLVVLGNTFVGKSCLLHRFTDGVFAGGAMMATVGVDWSIRTVSLAPPPKVALAGGRSGAAAEPAAAQLRVKLTLWDTAGQERFRSLAQSYYRGSDGIVLCYAVDSRETFDSIGGWLDDIEGAMPAGIPRVLVATKADVAASGAAAAADEAALVGALEGEALARRHGIRFFSTSAFTGAGVDAPFLALAQSIVDRGGGKRRGEHAHAHAQGAGASAGGGAAAAAAAALAEPVRLAAQQVGGAVKCSSC